MVIIRIYPYEGAQFQVTRTSTDSATVNIQCGKHDHQDFIVGLMEAETGGWVVGRKESGYPYEGIFVDAVEYVANLLIEECTAVSQLDSFFAPSYSLTS